MRRLSAVFLAAALSVTAACSGGDKDGSGGSDADARTLFQPAGVVGPDSFAPTFAVATYSVDPSTLTSGDVSGSAPGLYAGRTYGGTGANICDVEAMIRFLTYYEDRGRAWAAIQGISFEELPEYLRGLTPVFALQNLNVQMFGFKNGQSYGYDAVIAAGTAILVDDQGMPRARCACGNPLLGPSDPAPEGTDEPTPTEPEEGNPQTQDSVPGEDTVPPQPGDTPPGDQPGGTPPDDTPPGDRPGGDPEPECPQEFEGNTYIDAEGVEWTWVKGNPTPETSPGGAFWFDDSSDTYKTTAELDPSFVDCPEPDQPRQQNEPECPDWNTDPVTYVDPSGMIWIYDRASDTWFSTTDPDLFKFPTADLPGYLELCGQPGQGFQPECPQAFRGSWTAYYSSTGDVWRWEFTDVDRGVWVNQDGETVATLVEIPGYIEDCGTPGQTYSPECPEPIQSVSGLIWTDYRGSNGDLWVYDPQSDSWKSRDTGAIVAGNDPSGIPGYVDDCGTTTTEENPCPPTVPSIGDSWTDSSGTVWVYSISPNREDGRTRIVWRNTATEEERSAGELFADACGEPPLQPSPACPPTYAPLGTVWTDITGEQWVYARGTGGVAGWDQISTPEIETLTFSQLPNQPDGCPQPRLQLDCPPILNVPEGYVWLGTDGDVYRYSSADGGWLNQSDPAGQVVAYTVLLPGYRDQCLPPCPPVNVLDTDEYAMWVDPSNGDVWVRWPGESVWTNTSTGETRSRTQDVPFYTEDCLPPCDPQSAGGSTYVMNDDGIPETNDERRDEYGDSDDTSVTVTPGENGVTTQPIVEQLLDATTATGDDCNPNGCVEPDAEPELGQSFRDSYGVLWRFVGGGMWQSENGDFVTYLLDIPGYREACLPPETPIDRECPPEFKGSNYTDSNGIVWTWIGSHSTPEESDHGQYWWHMYEDGSTESRYTFQLESFFDDCPRPDDVSIQDGSIFVSLRAPEQVCVGETVTIAMTVVVPSDAEITDAQILAGTARLDAVEVGPGLYSAPFTPDTAGAVAVKGAVTDGNGTESSTEFVIDVVECADGSIQGDPSQPVPSTPTQPGGDQPPTDDTVATENAAPLVSVVAKADCVEAESTGSTAMIVIVTVNDPDGDSVTITLEGGSANRRLATKDDQVDGSGSRAVTYDATFQDRGQTFVFTVTADDGTSQSSDSTSITIEYPGGCSPSSSTSTPNTAPVVTLSTNPSKSVPVCKAGPSVTVTVDIAVSDPQGDTSDVTLSSYNKTTRLGTVSRAIGTVAGTGSVSTTETVTAAQIGQTIEYIGRADDGSLVGIGRVEIAVIEKTSGCTTTSSNTPGQLSVTSKCLLIGAQGTGTITFTVTDADGLKSWSISPKTIELKLESLNATRTSAQFSVNPLTKADAGKSWTIDVVDGKGVSGQYRLNIPALCG